LSKVFLRILLLLVAPILLLAVSAFSSYTGFKELFGLLGSVAKGPKLRPKNRGRAKNFRREGNFYDGPNVINIMLNVK
jgi:hypothetical protein